MGLNFLLLEDYIFTAFLNTITDTWTQQSTYKVLILAKFVYETMLNSKSNPFHIKQQAIFKLVFCVHQVQVSG